MNEDAVSGDFALTMDELRTVAWYVVESAEEVLPLFSEVHPQVDRPRAAIDAAWEFINGSRRTNLQRITSLGAHRSARAAATEIARLAARCAGDAAAAAYLHPLAKAHQVGHILRAPACAARIAELRADDAPEVGVCEVERAARRASPLLVDILARYPRASAGNGRVAYLMSALDARLRDTSPRGRSAGEG